MRSTIDDKILDEIRRFAYEESDGSKRDIATVALVDEYRKMLPVVKAARAWSYHVEGAIKELNDAVRAYDAVAQTETRDR